MNLLVITCAAVGIFLVITGAVGAWLTKGDKRPWVWVGAGVVGLAGILVALVLASRGVRKKSAEVIEVSPHKRDIAPSRHEKESLDSLSKDLEDEATVVIEKIDKAGRSSEDLDEKVKSLDAEMRKTDEELRRPVSGNRSSRSPDPALSSKLKGR